MRGSQRLPCLHLGKPVLGLLTGQGNASLNADDSRITTSLTSVATHAGDGLLASVAGREHGEPAIDKAPNAAQRRFGRNGLYRPASADPERNGTLYWQGIQTSVADLMPLPLEIDHLLGPQRA